MLQFDEYKVKLNNLAPTLEELGLLKMDFLGLRNLTVLDDAVKRSWVGLWIWMRRNGSWICSRRSLLPMDFGIIWKKHRRYSSASRPSKTRWISSTSAVRSGTT